MSTFKVAAFFVIATVVVCGLVAREAEAGGGMISNEAMGKNKQCGRFDKGPACQKKPANPYERGCNKENRCRGGAMEQPEFVDEDDDKDAEKLIGKKDGGDDKSDNTKGDDKQEKDKKENEKKGKDEEKDHKKEKDEEKDDKKEKDEKKDHKKDEEKDDKKEKDEKKDHKKDEEKDDKKEKDEKKDHKKEKDDGDKKEKDGDKDEDKEKEKDNEQDEKKGGHRKVKKDDE